MVHKLPGPSAAGGHDRLAWEQRNTVCVRAGMHVWRPRARGEATRRPGFQDNDAEGLVARRDAHAV
eukprot:1763067-Rhodomonas_salina.1